MGGGRAKGVQHLRNFGCSCFILFFILCVYDVFARTLVIESGSRYPVIVGILTDFIGPIHWTASVGQLTTHERPVQLRCGSGAFKCFQR